VKQGDVERLDYREPLAELHAFPHSSGALHADRYLGQPVNEPFLRDTVNVPYYNGRALVYPSVKLRMDFRDPKRSATFGISLVISGA